MQRSHLGALIAISLTLAACSEQLSHRPDTSSAATAQKTVLRGQSIAPASGSTIRTFSADINATVTTRVTGFPDQVATSPVGLKAAFLFQNGQVKTRVDVPGNQFGDGRARVATYDTATKTARVVFADTLAADSGSDATAVVNLLSGPGSFGTGQLDPTQPFIKKTSAQFQTRVQSSGGTTTSVARDDGTSGPNYLRTSSSFRTAAGNTQQSTFTFDPNVGSITKISSTAETSDVRQSGTTTVTYTDVLNMPGVVVPVRFTSTQTVLAKYNGQSANVTQDVTYNNAAINTLSDSYFSVGGQ